VETIRVTNETKLQEIRQQIDEKLKSADEKRDEIIKQLQEKLRLHVMSSIFVIKPATNIKFCIAGRTHQVCETEQ
jgi:chorismate mutase